MDIKLAPVPDFLPTVVFTDIDGEHLSVRPVGDDDGYYTQIVVGDSEVWLSARDTLALSQVLEKTAVAVGTARTIYGLPIISEDDESRPSFTLE